MEKKRWISSIMEGPITSQLEMKKLVEKRFGPGALSAWIAKRASLISVGDGSLVRDSFHYGVTQGLRTRKILSSLSSL